MKIAVAIIILMGGVIAYLLITRKQVEYITDQSELNSFKEQSAKEVARLKNDNDSLIALYKHDSAMRANQVKQDKKVIKTLTDRANSLLAQLNDSTPCCQASVIKSSVIALKDSVNARQAGRIVNDSLYIQNLQSSFDRRLAIEQQQRQLLEEENRLQSKVIEDQKVDAKNRKRKE